MRVEDCQNSFAVGCYNYFNWATNSPPFSGYNGGNNIIGNGGGINNTSNSNMQVNTNTNPTTACRCPPGQSVAHQMNDDCHCVDSGMPFQMNNTVEKVKQFITDKPLFALGIAAGAIYLFTKK